MGPRDAATGRELLHGGASSTSELRASDTDTLNGLRNGNQSCFRDSLEATERVCEREWRLRAGAESRGWKGVIPVT